jgi:hypothetical protein
MVVVFVVNAVCYGAIYYRIRKAAMSQVGASGNAQPKYHKTAKLMLLFVAVYLFQWWAFVAQAIWSFAGSPADAMYIVTVFFVNLGGVYNALVCTIIRRKYSSTGPEGDTRQQTASTAPMVSKH